jgi:hypothetical protein
MLQMTKDTTLVIITMAFALALVTMAATTMMALTPASALNDCQKNFGKDACRGCRTSTAANASQGRCVTPATYYPEPLRDEVV